MNKKFVALPYFDKAIPIVCDDLGINLAIDYDDVDHYEVECFIPIIVRALNQITEDEWVLAQFKAKKLRKEDQMKDLGVF